MSTFSYLFHALLTLFLFAVSVLALASGQPLQLGMLPWQGATLTYALFFGALAGMVSLVLAILRKWRLLFFLWSLAVFILMFWGFFFSRYHFAGAPAFRNALYLTLGALLALCGAWFRLRHEVLR